jgi:phospholipid/cholesterol/gamma-HCH transport system substrate-binding protein
MVGASVLAAMLILGWMIIQFGGRLALPFQSERYPVSFVTDRADGINIGSSIRFMGRQVGIVKDVQLDLTNNRVNITGEIETQYQLPGKLRGRIVLPNVLGAGAIIDLVRTDLSYTQPLDAAVAIQTDYVGSSLLPPEITDLALEMKHAIREYRESGIIQNAKSAVTNLDNQITKAGQVLDDLQSIAGDDAVKKDLRETIADLRGTLASAKVASANFAALSDRLGALPENANAALTEIKQAATDGRGAIASTNQRVNEIADNLNKRLLDVAKVIQNIEQITAKANNGPGTASMLVNDPRLYESLLATTQALQQAIKDIQRLSQQIEQEGFKVKF